MLNDQFDELHAPLITILRGVLPQAGLPDTGVLLDVACGAGHKLPLLAEATGAGVQLLGVDNDRAALAAYPWCVAGDAHALPLRPGCCAAVCCIAALGLFARPAQALAEMRRVLRPAGRLLLVTASQAWAPVIPWPAELAATLWRAYAAVGWPHHADLGADLTAQLGAAGFGDVRVRAFLLTAANPLHTELALLPWPLVRRLVAPQLSATTLAQCASVAAQAELEWCSLALVTVASQ